MTAWYRYSCEVCGHSGLTQDWAGYQQGKYVCPKCGGLKFEVEAIDAAPLPESGDEVAPEIDDSYD
ncbi:MAG: hypothetical protein JXA37_09025 [Chloroflexia bacterium]|nr:hypothetical protein [Chloroflexia bacterium]